jgi:hypothetical protein
MAQQGVAQAGRAASEQPELKISMVEVVERLHNQYAQMMAPMVQENAELWVGRETARRRIAELEAQVAALRQAEMPPAAPA